MNSENKRLPRPRATYRVQLHKNFTFDDAAGIASYLARLGISHLYASPYLKARPGSTHGYDIVDHDLLNPELGGDASFQRMVDALTLNGLSQLLDFVPNHMGAGGADNPLWLDVLEWGQDSEYAGWFDIDWDPDRQYLRGKLLAPFLGAQYGVELERGCLELKFDAENGSFAVWAYGTHKLPICPLHYQEILGDEHPKLERLGDGFAGLLEWRPKIVCRAAELKEKLAALVAADANALEQIQNSLQRINGKPGDLASWHALDSLIAVQNWRASYFRVAADDINYRRFFNINDLAGIRTELPDVFERTHRFLFRLLSEGIATGVRIDHIDGLYDPKRYLSCLREKSPQPGFYCVVEKVLARHESLRGDWPVQGTTGYDFINLMLGILIDPAGEKRFTQIYAEFTGNLRPWPEIVRDSKLWIMENEMSSELNVLARQAARVARQNSKTADFTRHVLSRALRQIIACFPVYRSYVDENSPVTNGERRYLDWAITLASRQTNVDPSVYEFLRELLSGDLASRPRSGFNHSSALRCAMRFQQYSGPVMAKGVEDTALYRYNRFIALNEVGGDPDQFGISLTAFHSANAERAKQWPETMLASATHDTKRGEDTRARLAVLSEMPDEWARHVQAWSRILRARRGDIEATGAPGQNDEYMFYQLLAGTWPIELLEELRDQECLRTYTGRVKNTMIKSVREAKLHSTWASPNAAYEQAMASFVADALDVSAGNNFFASFLPFVAEVARLGVQNTIAQTVLKLTVPGVPDFYQGSELWDLSMVDPDNRRAVDYGLRSRLLEQVSAELARDRCGSMRRYLSSWQDGRFKLAIVATLLDYRRQHPELFHSATYRPLATEGAGSDQVCCFCRQSRDDVLISVVARHPAQFERMPRGEQTTIQLPEDLQQFHWHDLLTGQDHSARRELLVQDVFSGMRAAVVVPFH